MINFTQLLRENSAKVEVKGRDRREQPRIGLRKTAGEMFYLGTKTPCQLLDISLGGFCAYTDKPFSAGALAQVEVVVSIQGQVVHLYGMTEWSKHEHKIGVRFTHPSFKVRMQLEGLISTLLEQAAAALSTEIDGSIGSMEEASESPNVIPTDVAPMEPEEVFSAGFVALIHGCEKRAMSWEEGEWPVQIRYLNDRLRLSGSIMDLSVQGCSVRTDGPFAGEFQLPVEISFRLRGLPFLLAGVPVVIDDPCTIGIQFTPMSFRRRDELAQLVSELRGIGKYQPDPMSPGTAPISPKVQAPLAVKEETREVSSETDEESERYVEPAEKHGEEGDFWKDLKTGDWDL
jgi:hypothetical protein